MERREIPVFSSFKARKAAGNSQAQPERDQAHSRHYASDGRNRKDDHRSDRRHRDREQRHISSDRHDRRDRHHEAHYGTRERPSRYDESEKRSERAEAEALVADDAEEAELFTIDRRGDSKNVEYGGLHRYSVPTYHRIGYGTVLGADKRTKIDLEASTEKGIVFRRDRSERPTRLLTKRNIKLEGKGQRLIFFPGGIDSRPASTSADLNMDYLGFRPTLKRKRGSESPESEAPSIDYRSVEGKAKAHSQPHDGDMEFESSSDDMHEASGVDSRVRSMNADLSRAAKDNPTDADAWLNLAAHQGQSVFSAQDTADLTSAQRRTVADVRLSIFEQAFKSIPQGSVGHDRLTLAYIIEGTNVWEKAGLARKWQDALDRNPASILLWREYLSYIQTNPVAFRYEHCKDAYTQCFEMLIRSLDKAAADAKPAIAGNMIYILLRFTTFARDAGYEEFAVAIWQALLEYYILAPDSLEDQTKLSAFARYWEGGSPKIGEVGAAGWRACPTQPTGTPCTAGRNETSEHDAHKPMASFAFAEREAGAHFLLSATDADEDESNDPFRFVMFSDVRPILTSLPETLDAVLLIEAFLCYLELPPLVHGSRFTKDWRVDVFLMCGAADYNAAATMTQAADSFSLFHDSWQQRLPDGKGSFVMRALSVVQLTMPENELLGEYVLALTTIVNPSQAPKLARRLLRSRPTSLRYYNAYALSQVCTAETGDHLEKAEQTWTKAITLSHNLCEEDRDDIVLLWHSWAMSCMQHSSETLPARVLLAVADADTAAVHKEAASKSTGLTMRSTMHMREYIDHMQLKAKYEHAALWAECLALLTYLTSGRDIGATLSSFEVSSHKFDKPEYAQCAHALEHLHQTKAWLIGMHTAARRPFRPTQLRDELLESKKLFSDNSAIASRYYHIASLTRHDDRLRNALRGAFSTASPADQTLVSWLFAIDAEIARCLVDGASATQESVRAFFRRALLAIDSHVKSSPLLWKRWFDFESAACQRGSNAGDAQKDAAVRRTKQVFFDGLRYLPWHKVWAIEGMAFFAESGDMSEGELQQIHDVLVDRELRLRVDADAAVA